MLKKIKSIFVFEEEGGARLPKAETNESLDNSSGNSVQTSAPDIADRSVALPEVSAQNRFLGILAQTIEKNNQPGFDYFEFRQSLINLAKLNMDEATRYKSAYAAAQAMGVSPTTLINSAKGYLNLLTEEGKKFSIAEQNQRTKVVEDRKNELAQISSDIQKKQEMISRLQAEVEQLTKTLETKKEDADNMAGKLEQTKAEFEAAMGAIAGKISTDIELMDQYLK